MLIGIAVAGILGDVVGIMAVMVFQGPGYVIDGAVMLSGLRLFASRLPRTAPR